MTYSIVISDPTIPLGSEVSPVLQLLKDIPGYESADGKRTSLLKGILDYRLHLLSPQRVLLEQASGKYPQATHFTDEDKLLTTWIFQEKETQDAFKMVINMILLATLPELKDIGAAASRMMELIPEGSGNISIDEEIQQYEDILSKDQQAQKIWRHLLDECESKGSSAALETLVNEALKKAKNEQIIK
ncbi:hypothetical protein N7478_008201 [Penicillium angulare]|uniref:uncharacterized protein n=1 Tax=Penicillium angulare TaxID=116970 RepID=UPI00253FBA02|nr:uncharacterized protein N7478_008201 [Penicillium angulare]KAJ5273076.1 hypothetical protein N7478_008201 [Penicillium angulare]